MNLPFSGEVSNRKIFFFALLLSVSIYLRVQGLWWGVPVEGDSYVYHGDEGWIFYSYKVMDIASLNFHPVNFAYPSLYIYVIGGFEVILGYLGILKITLEPGYYLVNVLEHQKLFVAGRLLTVFISLLTIYLTYYIGKTIYSKRAGYAAAFAYSLFPTHIVRSSLILMDVPMTFFFMLSFVCSLKAYASRELKWYAWGGLFAGLATATKYHGGFAMLPLAIAYILNNYREIGKNPLGLAVYRPIVVSVLFLILGSFIGCPYCYFDYSQCIDNIQFVTSVAVTSVLSGPRHETLLLGSSHLYALLVSLPFAITIPLYLLFLGGLYLAIVRRTKLDAFLLLTLASFLLVFGTFSHQLPHYFIPILFIPAIIIGRLVDHCSSRAGFRLVNLIIVLCLLGGLAVSLSITSQFQNDTRDQVRSWMYENIPPGSNLYLARYMPKNDMYNVTFVYRDPSPLADMRKGDYFVISGQGKQEVSVFYEPDNYQKYALLKTFDHRFLTEDWFVYFNKKNSQCDTLSLRIEVYEKVV